MSKEPILKPMSVARRDFVSDLTDLINNSMLPPFLIEDILRDVCNKINVLSRQQLEEDERRYAEALASQMKEVESKK